MRIVVCGVAGSRRTGLYEEKIMAEEPNKKFSVFISHKHQDRKFADPVRKFVETYGAAQPVEVFQSSDPLGRGPGTGRILTMELRDAVAKAGLFVLVYTYPDLDWDFCMMELGMALDPSTPQTRVMVLKCARRPVLETLAGLKYVDVTQTDDVIRFAQEVLTDPESFPNLNQPLTLLGRTDERVLKAGRDLAAEFAVISNPEVTDGEWAGFPFLQLELPLPIAKQIREGSAEFQDSAKILNQIVVSSGSGLAEVLGKYEAQGSLAEVLAAERFSTLREFFASMVARAARGDLPETTGPALDGDGPPRIPLLSRFRRVASLDQMQFEVLFITTKQFSEGAKATPGGTT
jgi:TIR domain